MIYHSGWLQMQGNQPIYSQAAMLMINNACVECHDSDNDNSWNINKWEKIAHKEPGLRQQPNAAAQPNDAAPGEK